MNKRLGRSSRYSQLCRIATILGFIACAAAQAEEDPLGCTKELPLPAFDASIAAVIPISVEVKITVGTDGRAESVKYSPADPKLVKELQNRFGAEAKYLTSCAGKTLTFTVRYVYEGKPTDRLISDVVFRPPGEIIVRCRPLIPKP